MGATMILIFLLFGPEYYEGRESTGTSADFEHNDGDFGGFLQAQFVLYKGFDRKVHGFKK